MITVINVFVVEPEKQHQLIEILSRATETSVGLADGFISAVLHRSLDGTKVTMYAQWRSAADYQAMRKNPAPQAYFERALTLAKFEPGVYEIVRAFTPTVDVLQERGLS